MLFGAISKRFDTIVDFAAFEDFISFERKGKNKVKRIENHKIKVTIEPTWYAEQYNLDVKNINDLSTKNMNVWR